MRLATSELSRHSTKTRNHRRNRRLLFEQFEDRRLLTAAFDDTFSMFANETLEVNPDGAWANDYYTASWHTSECINGEWHDPDESHEEPWFECYEYATEYAHGSIESWPSHGTLDNTDEGARAFRYVPEANYV